MVVKSGGEDQGGRVKRRGEDQVVVKSGGEDQVVVKRGGEDQVVVKRRRGSSGGEEEERIKV